MNQLLPAVFLAYIEVTFDRCADTKGAYDAHLGVPHLISTVRYVENCVNALQCPTGVRIYVPSDRHKHGYTDNERTQKVALEVVCPEECVSVAIDLLKRLRDRVRDHEHIKCTGAVVPNVLERDPHITEVLHLEWKRVASYKKSLVRTSARTHRTR